MADEQDSIESDEDEALDPLLPGGLSWPRVILTVAAFCWLAGAVGWFIGQREDDPPSADSIEAGFYLDMIAHHDQARTLALLELDNGENEVVRTFAKEVLIFQQYEIGLMEQALTTWGIGRDDRPAKAMTWMQMPVDYDDMPGLASPEQIAELRELRGAAADARFLELMAEHHRGGAHMAGYARLEAEDEGVRALASRMERNQSIEINEFIQTAERFGLDVDIAPQAVPPEAPS